MSQARGGCGTWLRVGARVQTIWDEGSGCDFKWYVGTITHVRSRDIVKISYDDPDEWEGEARYVHALPSGHPGLTHSIMVGADTPLGPTPQVPTVTGQPVLSTSAPVVMGQTVAPTAAQPLSQPTPGQRIVTLMAIVPGGQLMQFSHEGQVFHVTVPAGIVPGQQFDLQVG